ncbi:hypothetical protein FOZ61_006398 [Perkinsus olseni]|uniref:Peptidase A1 domain-containing protein n=1 Tax=Perkinsus olseni TaxID=32597 RepID=A0A7J6LDC7_PEROL|nr:hypothetical protein FOZ61_006398 [Perkinsus olseni]
MQLFVFYERGYLRTEIAVNGQIVHPIVDTGSVSFHVVGKNYFEDSCRRYPLDCYNLTFNDLVDQALESFTGEGNVTKIYSGIKYSMRALRKEVEMGIPESIKTRMKFYAVVAVRRQVESLETDTRPHAILGLGYPREEANSILDQLVKRGIISDENRVFTLMLPASNSGIGELTLGSLKPEDPLEPGSLVYLPILHITREYVKWKVMMSALSVDGGGCSIITGPVLLDSGSPSLAGPAHQVDELVGFIMTRARGSKGEEVIRRTTSGSYWLHCDDVKYIPNLELSFDIDQSTWGSLTISREYVVQKLSYRRGMCSLVVRTRNIDFWWLGEPFFRNRTIRFDAHKGRLGMSLVHHKKAITVSDAASEV